MCITAECLHKVYNRESVWRESGLMQVTDVRMYVGKPEALFR